MRKRYIALIPLASILVFVLISGCLYLGRTKIEGNGAELIPDVELEELPPRSLEGWSSVKSNLYTPENLYEYIDGEAEAFLTFDFRSLLSTTYAKNGSGEIVVDIYDMKSPKNAFGIYSSLRYGDLNYVNIGGQGFITEDELNFWKGRFFVKVIDLNSIDGSEEMISRLGEVIASKIPDPTTEDHLIRLLPKEGLVPNSARFMLKDMLGQSFLSNGFTAEYRIGGERCQFFYSEQEDEKAAERAFEMYRSTFPDVSPTPKRIGDESFIGNDPYYKTVIAFRRGRFLGAVLKSPDVEEGIKLIERFLKSLAR